MRARDNCIDLRGCKLNVRRMGAASRCYFYMARKVLTAESRVSTRWRSSST